MSGPPKEGTPNGVDRLALDSAVTRTHLGSHAPELLAHYDALVEIARAAEYAEGVLMRDPFDEVQRQHAAQVLREALAGPDTPADSQPEEPT